MNRHDDMHCKLLGLSLSLDFRNWKKWCNCVRIWIWKLWLCVIWIELCLMLHLLLSSFFTFWCPMFQIRVRIIKIDLQLYRRGNLIIIVLNFSTKSNFYSFSVTQRNNQQRNSTVPNMVNSIKQVNKVKPNVTRQENIVSPGYNSR